MSELFDAPTGIAAAGPPVGKAVPPCEKMPSDAASSVVREGRSMLEQAKQEFTARNTSSALARVDEYLQGNRASWSVLALRARILERLGRFPEAANEFRRVLEENPANEAARGAETRIGEQARVFDQARQLLADRKPDEALDLLQRLPASAASPRYLLLARAQFALKRLGAAEASIERFLAEQPDHRTGLDLAARIKQVRSNGGGGEPVVEVPPTPPLAEPPASAERRALEADVAAVDRALAEDTGALDGAVARIRAARPYVAEGKWQDDTVLAKAAHLAFATDAARALRNYNAHLIERSVEYGYITWPKRIQDYLVGRSVLDVGCGFGAFGNGFLVAGAASYTGVDPQMPLDSGRVKNKRIRKRAELGMTPRQVMEVCPDIHLVNGVFEDFEAGTTFDVIVLHNVTEHLMQIEQVMTGIRELMTPESRLIFHHHNFYCWNGHHQAPNQPAQYDEDNDAHRRVADWKHILIAPGLPDDHYFNTGLNQIRLDALQALIEREFAVEVWSEIESSKEVEKRLLPSRLARLQEHDPTLTRRDLMVNAVFCVARRKH